MSFVNPNHSHSASECDKWQQMEDCDSPQTTTTTIPKSESQPQMDSPSPRQMFTMTSTSDDEGVEDGHLSPLLIPSSFHLHPSDGPAKRSRVQFNLGDDLRASSCNSSRQMINRRSSDFDSHDFMIPGEPSLEQISQVDGASIPLLFELYHHDPEELQWKEASRFLRYEEDVTGGNTKWGEPYQPTILFFYFQYLKNVLQKGATILDVTVEHYMELCDIVTKELVQNNPTMKEHVHSLLAADGWTPKDRIPRNSSVGQMLPHTRSAIMNRNPSIVPSETAFPRRSTDSDFRNGNRLRESFKRSRALSLFYHPERDGAQPMLDDSLVAEAADVVQVYVCEQYGMKESRLVICRLSTPICGKEGNVAVRFFIFLCVPPQPEILDSLQAGKALCAVLSNKIFKPLLYTAKSANDIAQNLDCFLSEAIIIPPGSIDSRKLIRTDEIRQTLAERERRWTEKVAITRKKSGIHPQWIVQDMKGKVHLAPAPFYEETTLIVPKDAFWHSMRERRFFGGVIRDYKRRFQQFSSDWTDACHKKVIWATLFTLIATIPAGLCFGGLLGKYTNNQFGVFQTLISMVLSNGIWSFASCQPLIIQAPTGPVLIFEVALYEISTEMGVDYQTVRYFTGWWCLVICIVHCCFGLSKLLHKVTSFTEDIFETLICAIFIMESFFFLQSALNENPIMNLKHYEDCTSNGKQLQNGTVKENCSSKGSPNVALLSLVLFLGTFQLANIFKNAKNSFRIERRLRRVISDFGAVLSVGIATAAYYILSGDVQLQEIDMTDRKKLWSSNEKFFGLFEISLKEHSCKVHALALLAGFLVYTLLFLETGITELLILKKKRVSKGGGLHGDVILMGLLTALCSTFGLPWMCAAAAQSMAHIDALTVNKRKAPGEKEEPLYVIEQRVSTFGVAILFVVVIILGGELDNTISVPMAVLFGVFMYLGCRNLRDIRLVERALLIVTPLKHYSKAVSGYDRINPKKLWLYTGIQVVLVTVTLALKMDRRTAWMFPFAIILIAFSRVYVLPHLFSIFELLVLDGEAEKNRDKDEDEEVNSISSAVAPV
ncbi:unnamed protein product, partial [Mesorhabditis belari]|uniref:Anion exchange protein n=1 Tax=Mesorhabditis belari TaxID=2138241 RepID=A0AAF3ENQ5_9BILA